MVHLQAALELAFKERATGEPAQIPVKKHPEFIPNEEVGTSTHELNAPNQIKQVESDTDDGCYYSWQTSGVLLLAILLVA